MRFFLHLFLIVCLILLLFPVYVVFIASTHSAHALAFLPLSLLPGTSAIENYQYVLQHGISLTKHDAVLLMLKNSFMMALFIAIGKVLFSFLSAYALIYFRFPFQKTAFFLVFITLMLPIEVRIVPTLQVVTNFHLLNSMTGLTLPLLASATATFLFRQFFLSIPDDLLDMAKMDGTGPLCFLWYVVLPLSKTNIIALFMLMFIYGWNQYLWPLVMTSQAKMNTVVMAMQKLSIAANHVPEWNLLMTTAMLALVPPVVVMFLMQRFFLKRWQ